MADPLCQIQKTELLGNYINHAINKQIMVFWETKMNALDVLKNANFVDARKICNLDTDEVAKLEELRIKLCSAMIFNSLAQAKSEIADKLQKSCFDELEIYYAKKSKGNFGASLIAEKDFKVLQNCVDEICGTKTSFYRG